MHEHKDHIHRLKIAEGHLRGIQRMMDEGAYCVDIIQQINAVKASLSKISVSVLDQHLKSCLTTAVRGDDPNERERVLHEIIDLFETANKN
ncbi:MAG: metal-sensitive transcriptional regulator [Anaerolineaceae bacterium]|nr:metal-sensitive transcriptional regulator [Anaerolineaceae bacterium]